MSAPENTTISQPETALGEAVARLRTYADPHGATTQRDIATILAALSQATEENERLKSPDRLKLLSAIDKPDGSLIDNIHGVFKRGFAVDNREWLDLRTLALAGAGNNADLVALADRNRAVFSDLKRRATKAEAARADEEKRADRYIEEAYYEIGGVPQLWSVRAVEAEAKRDIALAALAEAEERIAEAGRLLAEEMEQRALQQQAMIERLEERKAATERVKALEDGLRTAERRLRSHVRPELVAADLTALLALKEARHAE